MLLNNLRIEHNQKNQRFFVNLQNSQAYVQYESEDQSVLDLKETFVPEKVREKGIGSTMVDHVLDYAKKENLEVIPTCPFVADYIEENAEYQDLVEDSGK